jgi:hypothetical protein
MKVSSIGNKGGQNFTSKILKSNIFGGFASKPLQEALPLDSALKPHPFIKTMEGGHNRCRFEGDKVAAD